jgi:hypothetical protein
MTSDAPSLADADAALLRAAIACAERAQRVADEGGSGSTAEVWAAAAAELTFAAKGIAVPLPARPSNK